MWNCLYRPCTYAVVKRTTGAFRILLLARLIWHIVIASAGAHHSNKSDGHVRLGPGQGRLASPGRMLNLPYAPYQTRTLVFFTVKSW
jgi:hypothetical protein